MQITKYVLACSILAGCMEIGPERDIEEECEVYNDLYSHSILFCDGRGIDNVEDVFEVCNHRTRGHSQSSSCVSNFDLIEVDEGCEVQHVCWREQ